VGYKIVFYSRGVSPLEFLNLYYKMKLFINKIPPGKQRLTKASFMAGGKKNAIFVGCDQAK